MDRWDVDKHYYIRYNEHWEVVDDNLVVREQLHCKAGLQLRHGCNCAAPLQETRRDDER